MKEILEQDLKRLKEKIKLDISDLELISILFEMNRTFDDSLKYEYKKIQKIYDKVFNSYERKMLRYYFYYANKEMLKLANIEDFATLKFKEEDVEQVLKDTFDRLEKYDSSKIINSIIEKQKEKKETINDLKNFTEWMHWHKEKNNSGSVSLGILKFDQHIYDEQEDFFDYAYELIRTCYVNLNNYRYMSIIVEGEIFDHQNINITWQVIYKLSVYAENFIKHSEPFYPFKQKAQIEELSQFIVERGVAEETANELAKDFYTNICTGFKYEDCLIDDKQDKKILIFKKIKLDESKVPCPSCMKIIESGNSYPEMFLRSWECKNECCPNRSKSGRGKRFDEFGVYRYFKIIENNPQDVINNEIYTKWRKDIFSADNDVIEMLIKFYSWSGERIGLYNVDYNKSYDRELEKNVNYKASLKVNSYFANLEELPIYKLLSRFLEEYRHDKGNKSLIGNMEIINDNSTEFLFSLKPNSIGSAITSPPYYNAREYSQWGTLILYLIDMMINASAVNYALDENATYLYNIGDIVANDNVYVKSHMSNRRLMLGSYSMLIFEIAGYHLAGNIIWNKGEVQSKRNSTVNLFPCYVKCINCYEHMFVFKKKKVNVTIKNKIERINPVIKINCKGQNTYKHTAPYPLELVEVIKNYADKSKYILDPFLGSGTTLVWCKNNGYKGVGIELNKEYYQLCVDKISRKED